MIQLDWCLDHCRETRTVTICSYSLCCKPIFCTSPASAGSRIFSLCQGASVHNYIAAGDSGCLVAGQEHNCVCYIFHCGQMRERLQTHANIEICGGLHVSLGCANKLSSKVIQHYLQMVQLDETSFGLDLEQTCMQYL